MATVPEGLRLPVMELIGFVLACCFISVIGNTGDVPNDVVYTDIHKSVEIGSRVVLKCQFNEEPSAVYWKKGDFPSTAPVLISRVDGEPISGSCDHTCEMDGLFSLFIINVSIADQGRYICSVSNDNGILFHNFTDLTVFAFPDEPFPLINVCTENSEEICAVQASNPLNITCNASKYFPNVNLIFLHGGPLTTAETFEWTNADRTKSKSISTRAPPSKIPYVCVAFNIPGSGSQDIRTTTVYVISHQDSTGDKDVPLNVNKIVVPIVVVVSCGLVFATVVIIYRRYGRKHRKHRRYRGTEEHDEESQPMKHMQVKGRLSYYELWVLANRVSDEGNDMKKLGDTFSELKITGIKSAWTPAKAYQALCRWKDGKRKGDKLKTLEEALKKADNTSALKDIRDCRENKTFDVPQQTFEDIARLLGNIHEVNRFLCELIPERGETDIVDTGDMDDVVRNATSELQEWMNGSFEVNPMVLLSLALETAGCKPVDSTFFTGDSKRMVEV